MLLLSQNFLHRTTSAKNLWVGLGGGFAGAGKVFAIKMSEKVQQAALAISRFRETRHQFLARYLPPRHEVVLDVTGRSPSGLRIGFALFFG